MTSTHRRSVTGPPLLETKFYVPQARHALVPRPRLTHLLDRGAESRLLLVSAPPGFGKTTLLSAWVTGWLASPAASIDARSAAWLSLDRTDNDPSSFWTHVVAALRRAAPEVGAGALAVLSSPQPPPVPSILTSLLNELSAVAHPVVLVLDDFHVIESAEVQQQVASLVDHVPPQLHLAIVSRSDPAIPLARLRARGELVEIRAADLRFTPDEAAQYLNGVMGLTLTTTDVAALEGRTEGWIAALQLAALSLRGREDVVGFIAGFAGDDRYIVDYLVEEVVGRQSESTRTFLLQTSILARLSGSLCDAVTGRDDAGTGVGRGTTVLEALDRANLFLVPLDDHRRWYRYHHLFADVLQARLLDEHPDQVPGLHRRASRWFEEHAEPVPAIEHALAAEDPDRAADLVEALLPVLRRDRKEARVLEWLQAMPDEVVRARPVLTISYVGALLGSGRLAAVDARLLDAERWLDARIPDQAAGTVSTDPVGDHRELARIPAYVAVYRAAQSLLLGDVAATVTHARRAVGLLADDDHVGHGAVAGLLGLAHWTVGDLGAAETEYVESVARLTLAGHVSDVLGVSIALADIRITQGRLRAAMRTYEQGLELAAAQEGALLRGTPDMFVGMSAVHRERGALNLAAELVVRSQDSGDHLGLPQNRYRQRVALSRIREAEGDAGGALELLDEAERLYDGDFSPDVRPVAASRARVWITQGRLDDAFDWVRERTLTVDDELTYAREFEHVTLARALLAQCRLHPGRSPSGQLVEFLDRLLRAAGDGDRTGTVLEVLVLRALAQHLRGDGPAAIASLERALALAEPEGFFRVLVDEGEPMIALLEVAAKQRIAPAQVRRLLAGFDTTARTAPPVHQLVDPLSERELVVLRLLGSDLGGPAIARELTVSLNTVRTHTGNIYAKLGVSNRRAAVRRAEELHLLTASRRHPA